ncbi:MAG: phosphorylase family protein [Candidatus Kariarchaeaceae archaeon]
MLQPHIKVDAVDPFCIMSGNPDRVPVIGSHLKDCQEVARHRGLICMKGYTPKKSIPVTILTTGMGTGSSGIILEEAFRAGAKNIIRVGSTGALQNEDDMGIGSIYIPFGALQDEGTSNKIIPREVPAVAHPELFQPLCLSAETLQIPYHTGLVWTTDIYYQPDETIFKKWAAFGAICVDMESSMMMRFCASKGFSIKSATILTADGNLNKIDSIYSEDIDENKKKFELGVENTIQITISAIERLNT